MGRKRRSQCLVNSRGDNSRRHSSNYNQHSGFGNAGDFGNENNNALDIHNSFPLCFFGLCFPANPEIYRANLGRFYQAIGGWPGFSFFHLVSLGNS